MRTASEKLDLMQARLGLPHNMLLSQIYHIMEEKSGAVLEDERLQVMEEKDLSSCSILTAVFYRQALKEMFQDIVDYNHRLQGIPDLGIRGRIHGAGGVIQNQRLGMFQ